MSPLDLSHSVNVASTTSHPDCANKGAEYCSDQASTAAHAQLSPINNVSGNDKTMSISQGCSSEESMSADHRCSSDASMNSDQRCGSLSPVIGDNDRNDDVVLFEFTFRQLMLLTIGAPLCALVASFVIGFSTDYDVLLNYEWTCGRVHLPSFSRIINMPKERLIWNILVVFHAALRPWLVLINYRICRSPATPMRFPRIHSALANCVLICGCTEIIFLVLLTVVGEREQSDFHVGFFVVFSLSSLIYFLLTSLMYRVSYHYVRCKQAPLSWVLKTTLAVSYLILLPTIFTFFTLYWQLCYSYTYDLFATFEYLTILVNFGFHATSILDSNDLYQMQQLARFLVCCLLIVAVDACKCRVLTAQEAFKNAEWVSRVKILRKEEKTEGGVDHIEYEVEHVEIFKNSRSPQLSKEITTSTSTAACGLVSLQIGKEYLLSGRFTDRDYLHINSCGQITDSAKNGQPLGFVLEWNEVPNDLKGKLSDGSV